MKKVVTLLMMFALMLVLAACGAKEEKAPDTSGNKDEPSEDAVTTIEITHTLDKAPVTVNKNPETVVVFDFGVLDTLDELGVEVAGVPQMNIPSYLSKYEDAKYENVGGLKEPDFEAIHAMQPDVIFISGRQQEMYKELSEIAPTIFVGVDNANYMESFKVNMEMLAKIFDQEEEMKVELADIDERILAVKEKADSSNEKALIILGNEGKVSAYGPSSRFGIIHDVFGFNPADEGIEVSTHGQSISFEYILETNPDVLFVVDRDAAVGGDASAKDSLENDIVKKTNAYANDKIYYLDPNYWYLSGGGLQSLKEMIIEMEAAL